jgi:hypothetical protein
MNGVIHIEVAQAADATTRHRAARTLVVEDTRIHRVRMPVQAVPVGHSVLAGRVDPVVIPVDAGQIAQHMHTLE